MTKTYTLRLYNEGGFTEVKQWDISKERDVPTDEDIQEVINEYESGDEDVDDESGDEGDDEDEGEEDVV